MVAELMERTEAEAWIQLQRSLPDEFKARFGIEVHPRHGGVILIGRNSDFAAFNRTLGLGFRKPLDDAELDAVMATYRNAGVHLYLIQWSPQADPPDAHALLTARGFRAGSRMAKLCRRTDGELADSSPFTIVEVDTALAFRFAEVLAEGHGNDAELLPAFRSTVGMPDWTHYLAFDGDRPIAGAALFTWGEMAWCGMAATLEADRGRGAHRALLSRRIRDAGRRGCTWISCETMEDTPERPNPSFHNMCSLGFEPVYLRTNYIFGKPAAS